MTAKTPKRMIRVPDPSIRGTRPPPRQVPGGGLPPGVSPPPRLVEGGGLLPPVPLPPLPSRAAGSGQVAVGALPPAAGRMKNSELRGKIAKLERDNAALVTRLVALTQAALAVDALFGELETYDEQPAGLGLLAQQLREALK